MRKKQTWQDVEIPDFDRKFVKVQKFAGRAAGEGSGRTFNAGGPKADKVVQMILFGGLTRKQMAEIAECSESRVGEVVWAMQAAGLDVSKIAKRAPSTGKADGQVDEVVAQLEEAAAS